VRLPIPAEKAIAALAAQGLVAGVPLSRYAGGAPNDLLVAVTEVNTRAAIDALADALGRLR
jgi:glycine cleavage system pyridoxal-binding protein P